MIVVNVVVVVNLIIIDPLEEIDIKRRERERKKEDTMKKITFIETPTGQMILTTQ